MSMFLVLSCGEEKKSSAGGQANNKKTTPQLDELRKGAKEKYINTQKKIENIDQKEYVESDCIPCDINYLTKLEKQATISGKDFRNLFCINEKSCEDNVEFLEYYNEVLYNSIDKSPQAFHQTFTDSLQVKFKSTIISQLVSPVHDGIEAERILGKVIKLNPENSRVEEYRRIQKSIQNH